jgi:type I restriction enzyme, S subunit
MKGWQTKSIGDVCSVVNGGTPKTGVAAYWDGSHQWLTPAEMGKRSSPYMGNTARTVTDEGLQNSSARLLPPYSVILSSRAPIGYLVINTEKMATNQGCKGLIPNSDIHHKFLFYYLTSIVDLLNDLGTGATFKELSGGKLKEVPIPLPPLPEQHRIVAILDAAFGHIATAKANCEANLLNARAIFESHLQAVFTQRGDGWVEKKLEDVCEITSMLVDPRKEEFLDLTHVGAGNIVSQTGAFVELKTAREEALISGKFPFDNSMVLYSKIRPYLMKVARPDFNGLCSADMYPLAPIPNEITRDYLYHMLLSKKFTDYAIQGSARAGMPKVNREHLFEFKVWLPAVKKQKQLAQKLDELHIETQRLESLYQRKLQALDDLKKSLLHQAFSGAL